MPEFILLDLSYHSIIMTTKQRIVFATVDEYLALQPDGIRKILEDLRQVIRKAAPEAEEIISYQMPAIKFHGIVLWYGAASGHYSIFPLKKTIEVLKKQLIAYEL